jgi:hypothetical protein
MKIASLILAHNTPNQGIKNPAVRESLERRKIEERARGVGRNNEEQWREGDRSEEEEAGKGLLTAFFRRFEGFRAVQRQRGMEEEGRTPKKQFKKRAVFGDFWVEFGKRGSFWRGVLAELCRICGGFREER